MPHHLKNLVSPSPGSAPGDLQGWRGFLEGSFVAEMVVLLVFAMALAAVIAYHPQTRRRVTSLEDFQQPKTYILYAMVGALVAQIVSVRPEMALVVFGIGGLLRFRSDVGEAKDTGRVILVTVIGLCTGLQLFVIAVLATLLGWMVIFALDRAIAGRLSVSGLDAQVVADSARAYSSAIKEAGLVILGEQKNAAKGRIFLVFRGTGQLDRAQLTDLESKVPPNLRGTVDWEVS